MQQEDTLSRFFFIRKQQTLHRVNCVDLQFVHADGNYCYLVTSQQKKFAVKISLRQLIGRLPEDGFARIHKSYVVNLDYLKKLDLKERKAYLGNGVVLPIGRTFLSDLTHRLRIV